MKTSTKLSAAVGMTLLATSFASGVQASDSINPDLAAVIRQQATQAQENIRRAVLADLHADARRHFASLPANAPLVLVAARPSEIPDQSL